MRLLLIRSLTIIGLMSSFAHSQTVPVPQKSVVRLEAILQRYTEKQVHDLLQKKLAEIGKTISQHETFEIRDGFEAVKDTVVGKGVLLADGAKLYIVTNKHLVKATSPIGVTQREVITDFLVAHLDIPNKHTDDINLLNFVSVTPEGSPVVFSDDKTDLAIISLQQRTKKMIADYIRQNGAVGIPVQSIGKTDLPSLNKQAIVPLLRKLQVNERSPAFNRQL